MILQFINYYFDGTNHYYDVVFEGVSYYIKLGGYVFNDVSEVTLIEKANEIVANLFPEETLTQIKINGDILINF